MYKNLNAKALGVTGHQSEIIELALTYGFRGMDVDIAEIARRAEKKGAAYATRLIRSATSRTGFRIGSFTYPFDWDVDDEVFEPQLTKLGEYAELAKQIGCTTCVATVAAAGDKRPYHENFEFHRQRLGEICKKFESYGLWLGIGFRAASHLRKGHAFQFIHELDALKLLVNMVGTVNIGICLDTWDLHVAGGSVEDIRELKAEQIVAVQIADMPEDVPLEEVTEAQRLLPGTTGRIDVAGMVAALAEIGFGGPVTCKPARTTLDATRRDPIVREAAEAVKKVWDAAGLSSDLKKTPVAAEG
jgi:sugar phosphate isomerase/epimerase